MLARALSLAVGGVALGIAAAVVAGAYVCGGAVALVGRAREWTV